MKYVGEVIKKKRLSKKLSLDEVALELNISKYILEKIEKDEKIEDFREVFIVGHLKSYAKYLELNSVEIVDQFKLQNSNGNNFKITEIPKPYLKNTSMNLTKMFSLTSIIIIFTSFYFLFVKNENSSRKYALIPDLPEEFDPIIEKAQIIQSQQNHINDLNKKDLIEIERSIASSSVVASSNISNDLINDNLITLKMINPTWLQLRDKDNNIILSQLMNKNEEFTYALNLNYSITSGNGGNILVLINKQVKGRVGEVGQVIDSFIIDSNFNN